MRDRIRRGAYSIGIGGAVVATQDLAAGAVLLAVAAGAVAVDERLTRWELLPWGE
jgi:hypothetical protein